ncbi:SGNH/GDSL hydrolase family protein [Magnetospirillum fulvum]|uniref:GDSL-like Lipase/Acylhydrolase family n=1 Tax=Magnetospirillum fulvum TaxID=1082 RepID=A0A1H6H3W0_MAGFU|nr:SGNH/GDSL hydrolase family protein [Magnetospirillum fulvum]SEH30391.1 GDSL-like Lipase/Acylhydrolase family [Magnetospirillum fulvum]
MRPTRSNLFGRVFSTVAVTLLSAVIFIAAAEYGAGLILKQLRDKRPLFTVPDTDDNIRKLFDTDSPARYREIVSEAWRQADTVYSPFVEFRMPPYQSRHFNIVEDGYRLNGASPGDLRAAGPKVFVFGGSTTLGFGVGDDETIPAYVEQALKAAGRSDVQVFNFGVFSYYSTQERIALDRLLTAGIKPDVAVFVDGINDFYYCTIPDVSAWTERLAQLAQVRARVPILIELSRRSNLVHLARHLGGDKAVIVREWGSFCTGEGDVAKVAHRLDTNRRIIDATAERIGFKALFVQQPVPTYAYDNRKRPFPVQEEMLGYHMNSARGYPLMAQQRSQGQLWERGLLWLAELEPAEGNAYIDPIHYSPRLNKAIGDKIAQAILAEGHLPPPPPPPTAPPTPSP